MFLAEHTVIKLLEMLPVSSARMWNRSLRGSLQFCPEQNDSVSDSVWAISTRFSELLQSEMYVDRQANAALTITRVKAKASNHT